MTNLPNDVICFSHLRWGFVFQRPQHLLRRCAAQHRVYFVEEPVLENDKAELRHSLCGRTGVHIVTPYLPANTQPATVNIAMRQLLKEFIEQQSIRDFIAWYYTPMALEFTGDLNPVLTVYDCMDELSGFANAPAGLLDNERKLFQKADLVFTGGASLYESKSAKHKEVHLFPSSVEVAHFAQAQTGRQDPADQQSIPHPRLGYAGVIDERMDLDLIAYLANKRPEWQIVLLGPVVKIDPASIPHRNNVHLLGMKKYEELPSYLSGWDVALLPFAQNDATRFISPTKTPEYLAAGLPVVSTPIRDVERPYGKLGLVRIGRTHEEFLTQVETQIHDGKPAQWQSDVDAFLSSSSWDKTWSGMSALIDRELDRKRTANISASQVRPAEREAATSVLHV
jgi:UDP-galactopyranose mutase